MKQDGSTEQLGADRDAYPQVLECSEQALLRERPGYADRGSPKPVGFGLSGGGIRSATFCLGMFQALAKLKLLKDIDYISSVSGGSYFASFYGRLFTRDDVKCIDHIDGILAPNETEPANGGTNHWMRGAFRWLRENGRYLAPHGAGDLLLDLSVVLRNWLSVQIVMAIFILMFLLAAQLIRARVQSLAGVAEWHTFYELFYQILPLRGYLWWSPYILLGIALAVFASIPAGWAYWLLCNQRAPSRRLFFFPRCGWLGRLFFFSGRPWLVPIAVLAVAVLVARSHKIGPLEYVWAVGAAFISFVTLGLASICALLAFIRADTQPPGEGALGGNIAPSDIAGNLLSRALKVALVASFSLIGFALIDTLGQTVYAEGLKTNWRWLVPLAGPIALAMPLAPFAHWIVANLGGTRSGKIVSIPTGVVAGIAAAAVIIPSVILLDSLSHAVAYEWQRPVAPPAFSEAAGREVQCSARTTAKGLSVSCANPFGRNLIGESTLSAKRTPTTLSTSSELEPELASNTGSAAKPAKGSAPPVRLRMQLIPIGVVLSIALLLSWIAGRSRRFLNSSSLHALYTARLVRAYLGASNPERYSNLGRPVTDVVPGDDIAQEEYWEEGGNIYSKSAPIHLLNVTINETYGGRSELEQHDRKGIGMAIGPSGISAGVKHHVVFSSERGIPPQRRWWQVGTWWRQLRTKNRPRQYERVTIFPLKGQRPDEQQFRVFNYPDNVYDGQRLALGSWTGISGAAFSTGLGFRTSLALSLLAGFFNVRLGYWWDSGISRDMSSGTTGAWFGRLLGMLFPVQHELVNESLSRFPGTSEPYWYLSDGGHFENMGGYELIRRRLPLIVIVDAEADPNYAYEGLASLVQKARLDFGTEIEFCDKNRLDEKLGENTLVRRLFGTLEQLRRGVWAEEPVKDPVTRQKRLSLAPVDCERFSLAHAALAEIKYGAQSGAPQTSGGWLILIKPTLTGNEPTDVLRYHSEHPSFPHETTANQWFDESQWESYRKLGEHIGMKVFGSFPPNAFPKFNAPAPGKPAAPKLPPVNAAELPLV